MSANNNLDENVVLIANDDASDASESSDDDYYYKQNQLKMNELSSNLQKWTNYLSGWQDRYLVLKDGILSYYKGKRLRKRKFVGIIKLLGRLGIFQIKWIRNSAAEVRSLSNNRQWSHMTWTSAVSILESTTAFGTCVHTTPTNATTGSTHWKNTGNI